MAINKLDNLIFTFTFRPAPESGPTSSDDWNDSFNELSNDLSNISLEWNNKLKIIIDSLPDGSLDTQINVFVNGLDGKNLWVDKDITVSSDDLTYFNTARNRPNTVKEQFDSTIEFINNQINQSINTILDSSAGLTVDQKNRIGANVFDNTQTSSSTSLDGKSEINRLNIIQLAGDIYGNTAQLNNNGIGMLTNANIFDMISQLLAIHNSAWNTGTIPSHTGAFGSVAQSDVTSSAPGNDSFVGSPTNAVGDFNQLRTQLKNTKGTSSYLGTHSQLYSGGADSLEDLLVSTQGTSTKTSTNPWGYDYTDITGLNTRLEAIKTFTGQDNQTDSTPDYSSSFIIGINDPLETAIGKLDSEVNTHNSQLSALEIFVGQNSDTDITPTFTSGIYVNNGDSLETAIDKLDLGLAAASGQDVGVINQIAAIEVFIGQDSDTDNTPDYSSTEFITNGNSLQTAIGILDLNLSDHSTRHLPSGIDALSTATPVSVSKSANSEGIANSFSRSDHKHDISTAAPSMGIGSGNTEGSATTLARSDHNHSIRETGGPTDLTMGSVSNNQFLTRSGSTIIGSNGPSSSIQEATGTVTTTSATDVLVPSMTVTPISGTYLVWFTGSTQHSANDREIRVSIYSGGVQVASSERILHDQDSKEIYPFCCTARVTVNGSQAIEGLWRTTAATASMYQRNLMILRVS